MLTAPTGPGGPGIIEGGTGYASNAARRRSSHRGSYQRRASSIIASKRGSSAGRDAVSEVNGITIDRLTYMNTALDALPGFSLREYFVPIMRLKKQLLLRQRRTKARFPAAGTAAYTKMITDAVASLAKSLSFAGGDLVLDDGTATLNVDPKRLAELLKGKLTPICMEAGGVLSYPREAPEASFVYVVLSGMVTAMYFQPQALPVQQRRAGGGGRKERQTYFTSAKDVVRLCGGGVVPDSFLLDDYNNTGTDSGATVDAASMSNMTTAIQRSLRRASRTVGQPTLQYTRMEQLRGPVVLGATEAIGLAPCKYVTYVASAESSGPTGKSNNSSNNNNNNGDEVEVVQGFRMRTADVHAALVQLAAEQQAERQGRSPFRCLPWCTAQPNEVMTKGTAPTMADFIVAARRRTLYNDYAPMELMMRQSWLLQDAPPHTIRTLIAHLEPHTYMPGEVIACPHTPGVERQLCFLRRGCLHVYAVPKANVAAANSDGSHGDRSASSASLPGSAAPHPSSRNGCECWLTTDSTAGVQPAEVVESGASFGELSVLFQEPRNCVLRAATVCDVWCLPHRSFTNLMQRDAGLRDGLLQKAAVLRIEWMSEQRFTRALAQQLRSSSQLLHPLPDIAIRLIQERLEPVVYAPGSLVVSTSTKCDEVIFIMHGTVSSICAGVASYGPGDVLGEGCLVPHRWPLGLAARTMVEGWRIKADQLSDAFRRMDRLHQYSGLVTSQTAQLMKQIFGTPQPDIEVDAVGRQRMPMLGAAPGGAVGYLAYGRAVSEVQLKATCFLYRDYVRWEDINYSTIDGGARLRRWGAPLDALARELAIQGLEGGKKTSVAAALAQQSQQQQQQQHSLTPRQPQKAAAPVVTERPTGKENELASTTERKAAPAVGSGRNAVRASHGQHARPNSARVGRLRGRRSRVASAGAFLVKNAFLSDDVNAHPCSSTTSSTAATAASGARDGLLAIPLPPRLQRMTRLLEERNRTWAAEQRHEATLAQQEVSQREAAVREQVALHASAAATAHCRPSLSARKREATAVATGIRAGGAPTPSPSWRFSLADVSPAPVHIFLQADKPKFELDLKEAIAIGYVMQLPDIAHIQYSVSMVDPDVALGPPAQRARRHLMSITPNDRYNKHNFLFAAAAVEDGSSVESQKAAAEATLRSKAHKLYTMMRTSVAARLDAEVDQAISTPHQAASRECSPDNGSGAARPPDTLVLADELRVRSPKDDADGLVQSPPIGHKTPSPKRAQPLLLSPPPVVHSSSAATPSPLRGSLAKGSQSRPDEALQRMLQRDPVQAIDLLRKFYDVPWSYAGNAASGQPSPVRHGADSRSVNGSGLLSSVAEVSGESQRRAYRPTLLDRLETAVVAEHATSLSGLTRAPPSRDGVSADSSSGAGGGDAEELLASGEVVLTNNNAPTFPPLVCATARDRWHSGNHLTPGSAPPGGGGGDGVAVGGGDAASQRRGTESGGASANTASAAVASAAAALAPDSGTLCDYFYNHTRRRFPPALFVEGYGPLEPLAEEWVEYPPTIHVAAAAAGGGGGGGSNDTLEREGGTGSGTRVSRPTTAVAAAAALRRSTSRPGNNTGSSSLRAGEGVNGRGFGGPGAGAFGGEPAGSAAAAPWMERFEMPTPEDTEVVIRRIQRDVNGLNAVTREQRRERDMAQLRNGRVVRHRAAVAAALSKPDEQEQELLETWRGQFARLNQDPLRRASVPAALREEGGPDYMRRELRQLANAPVLMEDPLWRYTKDLQVWQEQEEQQQQQQQQHGEPPDASLPLLSRTGGSGSGGGAAQDGPRRVVATIGTGQLGFSPAPLQSPTAQMSAADSQAWVRQREDFFAAYKTLLEHPNRSSCGGAAASPALAAPILHFASTPPPSNPAVMAAQAQTAAGESEAAEDTAGRVHGTFSTAALTDRATSLAESGSHQNNSSSSNNNSGGAGGSPGKTSFGQPSTDSSATPSPIRAMGDSVDSCLHRPRPDLPARYGNTPMCSYDAEAADHRVAVTPPREQSNVDDTREEETESSKEYSTGELEEEELDEETDEHSAVLGGSDMAATALEDSTAAAGRAELSFSRTSRAKREEQELSSNTDSPAHDAHQKAEEDAEEEEEEEEEEERPPWLDI